VADAAALLEVVAGYDPKDPQSAESPRRGRRDYTRAPSATGLKGARIGVVDELFGGEPAELESAEIVREAVADIRREGATVVGAVPVQQALDDRLAVLDPLYTAADRSLLTVLGDARTNNYEQKFALDRYLLTRGPAVPVKSTQELIDSGKGLPSVLGGLRTLPPAGLTDPGYIERLLRIKALQAAVLKVMADLDLDALVFPMKTQIAPRIGASSPPGRVASTGNVLGAVTGFPSLTVPAGFSQEGMPVGVELLGRPFTEWELIRYASDYEAATRHRRPPRATPPLRAMQSRRHR
jgi:Asp-tRNA(Asn)/Glu-tRNA(Gln) amidotransferase A subunit family amidase